MKAHMHSTSIGLGELFFLVAWSSIARVRLVDGSNKGAAQRPAHLLRAKGPLVRILRSAVCQRRLA
jgi:hypothetical protein